MESYEARNHADKLESALRRLRLDSERLYTVNRNFDKAKRENKKLKEQLREANKFEKYYNVILRQSTCKICPQCDGDGGFAIETPEGMEGEVCDICEGVGVVPKDYELKPSKIQFDLKPSQRKKDPF